MKEIKIIREEIINGNLYISFEIDNTEICYSSEWGVLELYKGDENLLENNRAVLYNNISEIKKKYESTFDDIDYDHCKIISMICAKSTFNLLSGWNSRYLVDRNCVCPDWAYYLWIIYYLVPSRRK